MFGKNTQNKAFHSTFFNQNQNQGTLYNLIVDNFWYMTGLFFLEIILG